VTRTLIPRSVRMQSMTTTRSNTIASIGATIYESPDGGKTIYARERGSSDRVLIRSDNAVEENNKLMTRRNRLMKICELAETVPALNDQLRKLETLYLLVKNEND
jgi:hypothetical protein